MLIDQEKCNGCQKCLVYCCTDAIYLNGKTCTIDEEKCIECYVCKDSDICPHDAFTANELEWPRVLRHSYSAVDAEHHWMGISGRGTMEMKTNDVTGHYRMGEVGFNIDVGRPGVTATFVDVEKIAMAVAKVGVKFDELNPTTNLMTNPATGEMRDDIKNERFLSCILEFKTDESKLTAVVEQLNKVAHEIETIFSVGCISRCDRNGVAPAQDILDANGIFYSSTAKINIGMGRPLAK